MIRVGVTGPPLESISRIASPRSRVPARLSAPESDPAGCSAAILATALRPDEREAVPMIESTVRFIGTPCQPVRLDEPREPAVVAAARGARTLSGVDRRPAGEDAAS